jgi:hypothetical protein
MPCAEKQLVLDILMKFSEKESSNENILFLLDCQKLDTLRNEVEQANMIRRIYKKYIMIDSPYEINIPGVMMDTIRKSYELKHYKDIFKRAFKHICFLFDSDILPRFRKSVSGTLYEPCLVHFGSVNFHNKPEARPRTTNTKIIASSSSSTV